MSEENKTIMVESKETITFAEFQAWLTGLIRGKAGALPDLDDWRMIKKMLDKVVAEKEVVKEIEYIPAPAPTPTIPWQPRPYPKPYDLDPYRWDRTPENPWYDHVVWCSDNTCEAPPINTNKTYADTRGTYADDSMTFEGIEAQNKTEGLVPGLADLELLGTRFNAVAETNIPWEAQKAELSSAIDMMISCNETQ